jgi:tetratricopeptide (TPR) repeat protein
LRGRAFAFGCWATGCGGPAVGIPCDWKAALRAPLGMGREHWVAPNTAKSTLLECSPGGPGCSNRPAGRSLNSLQRRTPKSFTAPEARGRACPRLREPGSSHPQPRGFSTLLILSFLFWFCLTSGLTAAIVDKPAQAQAHANKGLQFIKVGDLRNAEAELRLAVETDPQNAVYLGSLGAVLGMERKLEESNTYLLRALQLHPDDSASRRNLASNQYQLGQLQAAKANLQKVLKTVPDDKAAILLLGMVSEESKDYAAAVKWLTAAPDQVHRRPEAVVALGRAYYNTGEKEKARETLKDLLAASRRPEWQEAIFLGGRAAAQAGDYETAEQIFASISTTYPDTTKLVYHLALAQYDAGHFDKSEATLRELNLAGRQTSDSENLMAWCLYKRGQIKEAVAAMDRAIALDPSAEDNYLDVGMMLLEQHRDQGAFAAAVKALEVAPASYRAWRLKGSAEARLDRIKDAKKSFARGLELNPLDEQSILGLASEQLNDGKVEDAKQTLEKGIERLPRDAVLYQAYGRMLLWLQGSGNGSSEDRAISLLQTALRLDDSLADPHYQLGKLAARKGWLEEALNELQTANRLDPKSSQTHYELAMVYRKLGRAEDATRELLAFRTLKSAEGKRASGKPQGGRGELEMTSPLEGLSRGPGPH